MKGFGQTMFRAESGTRALSGRFGQLNARVVSGGSRLSLQLVLQGRF